MGPQSRCRMYFISYPRSDDLTRFQPTLFCADISEGCRDDDEVPWFQLVSDEFRSERSSSVTLAESLLRERMRTSATGLADYEIDPTGRIVVTAFSRIFCTEDSLQSRRVPETLVFSEAPVSIPLQPVICPTNRDLIACVANSELTVGHVPSNTWVQLTHVANENGLSVGMPSYVVQEEFDRYIGYWWRPSQAESARDCTKQYEILYEVVDERKVQVVHLVDGIQLETHRYPRAGKSFGCVRLTMSQLALISRVTNIRQHALPRPLLNYIPGFEYLVRAGWTPDGK
ncbi:Dipeptidyl-peptidase 9 (S09 family) [Fasciolopsis buskii]|uniref:Dipeptidyl-peptidase 9 (S09 family) n=1 Tax=Fasciolopsis buskii TaxID=27845 RepID=A0A8E0RNV0_9TREM|nr:Dipeptidyl-peptidase 9 (S09 family) [Fasciolopsis buski]